MDSVGGDSASLKFWDRMIMFGGTTLYAVAAIYVADAFRPAKLKRPGGRSHKDQSSRICS